MATQHDSMSAWNKLDDGQKDAFIRKAWFAGGGKKGGDRIFMAAIQNEVRIEFVETLIKLIDDNGRGMPPAGFTENFKVMDASRAYHHVQPWIDLQTIYANFRDITPNELEIVTYDQFVAEYSAIMAEIADNKQVANLSKGLCLPVILPKCAIGDYGETLEQVFLKLVEAAYVRAFPGRTFQNWRKGELAKQITIVPDTGHDRVINRMREQSFVAVFAMPFQGFSIPAGRAMMANLPKHWALTGAIDTSVAFAMHPEILARNFNTPVADCAGNSWRAPEFSLYLRPFGQNLDFCSRSLVASVSFSAGVLVLQPHT